jgi:hypothetical protein
MVSITVPAPSNASKFWQAFLVGARGGSHPHQEVIDCAVVLLEPTGISGTESRKCSLEDSAGLRSELAGPGLISRPVRLGAIPQARLTWGRGSTPWGMVSISPEWSR